MFYDFAIVVPYATPITEPIITRCRLSAGICHRVEVQFPIGTLALTRCCIIHQGHQWLPSNPDGCFASDGYVIPIDEYHEIQAGENEVVVIAWNLDDTYDHTINVRFGILDPAVLTPTAGIVAGFTRLLNLFGLGG